MKAVVLAAGEGKRLRPLTENRPKHLIPIGGKALIDHLIESLAENGLTEIIVLNGYKGEQIKAHLGDGSGLGVKITHHAQPKPVGTANAVWECRSLVRDDDFLLVYGDLYLEASAIEMILARYKQAADTTMGVVEVENPSRFGIVTVKNGLVKDITEKPRRPQSNLANAGVYVLKNNIFKAIKRTRRSARGEYELTDSLRFIVASKEPVQAVQFDKKVWLDTGQPWDFLEANERAMEKLASRIDGLIERGVTLLQRVVVAKDARVHAGAFVEGPVYIGEEAEIGPNCRIRGSTHISKGVQIGNGVEIKNSIIMPKTKIPHQSYVGDSIIGSGCNFGAGTKIANLRFDDATVRMRIEGKTIDTGRRKLGAVIGDNVKTGISASIMPGIRVGGNSWIGPNVLLSRDVAPYSLVSLRQALIIKGIREKLVRR